MFLSGGNQSPSAATVTTDPASRLNQATYTTKPSKIRDVNCSASAPAASSWFGRQQTGQDEAA